VLIGARHQVKQGVHQSLGVLQDGFHNRPFLFSTPFLTDFQLLCNSLLRLVQDLSYIKQWAKENQISYPFETPWDLFLQLLREDFLVIWQLGPENQEKEALSKAKQRDNLAIRVRLLKQSPWLMKETGKRKNYTIAEQEYLQYLRRAGWSGYWLLALRSHSFNRQIERNWESYAQALSKSKELTVDILDWSKGHPFDRPRSNSHRSVEGTIDLLGYIHWVWK